MAYEAIRVAIEPYFTTQWAAATPIEYDNIPYVPVRGTPWVKLRIIPNFSTPFALSSTTTKCYRYFGIVQVDIFVPQDSGTKALMDYADTITTIFRGQDVSGVLFYDMEAYRFEEQSDLERDQDWLRMILSFHYHYDEVA